MNRLSPFLFMCYQAEDAAMRKLSAKEYREWVKFYQDTLPRLVKAGGVHNFVQTCWY